MPHGFYEEEGAAVELPHPPISLSVSLVVEEAVRAAWELVRTRPSAKFALATAEEDEVTHELYERLYDEVFNKGVVEGFDRQLFTVVTRESKVRNYDGAMLDKRPDLLIGLADRTGVFKPSQDWIFIECKPVDCDHSVGVYYCDKGVIRFVRGEYAWAMTSALMIGYAHKGYTIHPKLTDALAERPALLTVHLPRPCRKSKAGLNYEAVQISRHERAFSYVETRKQAPAITVRHLWLNRD